MSTLNTVLTFTSQTINQNKLNLHLFYRECKNTFLYRCVYIGNKLTIKMTDLSINTNMKLDFMKMEKLVLFSLSLYTD